MRADETTASLALVVLAFAATAGGCGGRTFSAEEFVEEANMNGAMLELGETAGHHPARQEGARSDAGGHRRARDRRRWTRERGLAVGLRGHRRRRRRDEACEAAADLLCFQAGNVVVVLEGGGSGRALRGGGDQDAD